MAQDNRRYLRLPGRGIAVLLTVGLIWEISSRSGIVSSAFLPPLTKILLAFWHLVVSFELPKAASVTLGRCAGGYFLAAAIAIPLGVGMGKSKKLCDLLEPLVETLRPIPSAAIIPVAILFLGIENQMKIAVIVFGSMWPILLNTMHGVQTIDPFLIDTGRTFNLSAWDFLRKITIPAALPNIATGLRISLAISLILTITVEMIAGSSGLGFLILDYERAFKYPPMYAGILALGLIGFIANSLFVRMEHRFLFWSRQAVPTA